MSRKNDVNKTDNEDNDFLFPQKFASRWLQGSLKAAVYLQNSSSEQFMEHLLAFCADIPLVRLVRGDLDCEQQDRLISAARLIASRSDLLGIDPTFSGKVADLKQCLVEDYKTFSYDLLFVEDSSQNMHQLKQSLESSESLCAFFSKNRIEIYLGINCARKV